MTDESTARDTAALVALMYLVMRRIWDHAGVATRSLLAEPQAQLGVQALDEPMSMSALADRLGTDASYVTTIADQLEQRGLIERQPHPADRRIESLALTPEGRRLREQLAGELWTEVPLLDALSVLSAVQVEGRPAGIERRGPEPSNPTEIT